MRWRILTLVPALLGVSTVRASVDDALDTLHASGVGLKSLAADVTMHSGDADLGDDKTRVGRFVLQRLPDGDTRVKADFTERRSGHSVFHERQTFLLAGTDLIDRDYVAKKQTTRQVREPGEKVDLFKLGEGPFPLPVGQTREAVRRDFDVDEVKNDDPAATAVVKLSPKAGTPLAEKFKSITVKVDRATKLPSVITTVDPRETETNTVTLNNVRVNGDVSDKEFELEPINPTDWNLIGTK